MSSRTRRLVSGPLVIALAVVLACGTALAVTISGDAGPNTIMGTDQADALYGYGGDDKVSGGSAADRVFGGDGNDELFGTDEDQTGIADGNKTSVDGNDRVEGDRGDDTVIGATQADTLRGGPGSDLISDGPGNDQALDTIEADPTVFSGGPPPESSTWNDRISTFNEPAAKDTVNCGPGTDEVQADPLDVINANCENVQVVDPAKFDKPPISPATGQPSSPLYLSGDEVPEPPSDPDPTVGDEPTPPASEVDITAEGRKNIYCWSPGWIKASRWCGQKWVGQSQRLGVGMYWTDPNPTLYFYAYFTNFPYGRVGVTGTLKDNVDEWDFLAANNRKGQDIEVFTQNSNKWTGAEYSGWLVNY